MKPKLRLVDLARPRPKRGPVVQPGLRVLAERHSAAAGIYPSAPRSVCLLSGLEGVGLALGTERPLVGLPRRVTETHVIDRAGARPPRMDAHGFPPFRAPACLTACSRASMTKSFSVTPRRAAAAF